MQGSLLRLDKQHFLVATLTAELFSNAGIINESTLYKIIIILSLRRCVFNEIILKTDLQSDIHVFLWLILDHRRAPLCYRIYAGGNRKVTGVLRVTVLTP